MVRLVGSLFRDITCKTIFQSGVVQFNQAMVNQAGAFPGFCSRKRLGLFLLPPGLGCLSIAGLHPALSSTVPIYTPGPGDRHCENKVSCLRTQQTQCSRPGLEPGPLDPGTSTLTMRPPSVVGRQALWYLLRFLWWDNPPPCHCNATEYSQTKLIFTPSFQALWHEPPWWRTHGSNWRQRDAPVTEWLHKRNQCSHTRTWYQHHCWAPLAEALCSQVQSNFTINSKPFACTSLSLIETPGHENRVVVRVQFWLKNCQKLLDFRSIYWPRHRAFFVSCA